MKLVIFISSFAALTVSLAHGVRAELAPSAATTATINVDKAHGQTKFLGSGFIYGFPDNGTSADNSIPSKFLNDIKFNACRAGGAQTPSRGWAYGGYKSYVGRFNSTLSNYRTTRKYGATFILLPHDLWGADGGASSSTLFPGDKGDWTEMQTFLKQLIADLKSNNMLDGLVIDLWNEPDIEGFWARPWAQYVEFFVRASTIVRAALPGTLISGPSSAHSPSLSSANWKAWMSAVSGNKTVPDIYSWHQIGNWEREPDTTIPDFNSLRKTYALPEKPIDVNEYAWPSEQNPANSVYYLSQLERYNIRGLRANWGGGTQLHDFMANLVGKTNGKYFANGEWQLYKYYANMVGERVETAAASDLQFDVFAVKSDNVIKIIAGTRTVRGSYTIKISGLGSLGLAADGSINVRSYRFDWKGAQGEVSDPVDLGLSAYKYSSGTLNIPFNPPTNSTAFAYEFSLA